MLYARDNREFAGSVAETATFYSAPVNASETSLVVTATNDQQRLALEKFIFAGYQQNFAANLTSFMPILVGLKKGHFRAGLGLRKGSEPLFIEQYFSQSIESTLLANNIDCGRENIVELGNLYSTSFRYMLPLMISCNAGLQKMGKEWAVCTLTHQLQVLFSANGLNMVLLGDASHEKLSQSDTQWGRYYETLPKVYAISLTNCSSLINNQPALTTYRDKVQQLLPALETQLERAMA